MEKRKKNEKKLDLENKQGGVSARFSRKEIRGCFNVILKTNRFHDNV